MDTSLVTLSGRFHAAHLIGYDAPENGQWPVAYCATKEMGEREIFVAHAEGAEQARVIAAELNALYGSSLEETLALRHGLSVALAEEIAEDIGPSPEIVWNFYSTHKAQHCADMERYASAEVPQ